MLILFKEGECPNMHAFFVCVTHMRKSICVLVRRAPLLDTHVMLVADVMEGMFVY